MVLNLVLAKNEEKRYTISQIPLHRNIFKIEQEKWHIVNKIV